METDKKAGFPMENLLQVLQQEQERWKTEPVTLEGIQAFVQTARLVYERAIILQHLAAAEARDKRVQTAHNHARPSDATTLESAAESTPEPPAGERKGPVFAFAPRGEAAEATEATKAAEPAEPAEAKDDRNAVPHLAHPVSGMENPRSPMKDGGPSLAQQLKQSGIPALGPAMGINDRVRFASTFTGGDVQAFLALCAELEGMENLAEAREKLQAAAGPLVDWKDEEGPAWAFLQLVQRLQNFMSV